VLVAKHRVQAVSLSDGRQIWSVELDKPAVETAGGSQTAASVGALPAGRGFMSGERYYLPLSTAEVICIDAAQGKIVSRTRSRKGFVPGNLICYKGDVISLGVDSLDAFYQLEPLRDRIAATLKTNPDDPESLALRGQIELNSGRLADAIRDIHRSYDKDMSDSARAVTRGLLVDAMLGALRSDFRNSRGSVAELEKLITLDSEQAEFLRMLADGLQNSDDKLAAVDAYLRLADLKWGQGEPESTEPNLSVRRDRWVEARLASLYASASASERSKIDDLLSQRIKGLVATKNEKDLRAFISYFDFHPTADIARAELVRSLTGNDSLLERQLLISELEQSADPAERRLATAEMADLLKSASRPEEAATYYGRLNTEFASQICLDGKTGKQIVDELSPDSPELHSMNESNRWPSGAVKHDGTRTQQGMNFPAPMPIPWHGDRGPFFQSITVLYDMQQQIVGRDGLGRAKFSIPLSEAGANRFAYQPMNPYFVSAKGHLLFANLGYQLLALDTLRPMNAGSRVLWQQELVDLSNNGFNSPIAIHSIRLPWGTMKQVPEYSEGAAFGVVGPITDHCVCIARSHDLTALDPLTGATLWTWHGLSQGSEVFGDNDVIIVATQAGADSTVLRTADGQRLGHCNVPPVDRRAGYHGRRVLTWRSADGPDDAKIQILLADPWKGQDLPLGQASGSFSPFMKGTLVDDDTLAILEPNNRFRVFSLDDGHTLVDDRLLLDHLVDETIVEATPDQFILFAKSPEGDRQINSMQYRPMEMQVAETGMRRFTGSVFAFDRKTGKQNWSVPAQVDGKNRNGDREYVQVVLGQGQELPVLVFLGVSREGPQSGNNESKGSILCLDKRTGRELLDEDITLQPNNYHLTMTADRQANTVTLNLSNHTFTLTFTDDPIPPEPPYQARLAKLAKAPLTGAPTKSIIDALRKASGLGNSDDDGGSDGQ
jgi:outer membrane protein assembly factor BamB